MMECLKPGDIYNAVSEAGIIKAEGSFRNLFILGILAGALIAFAGCASTIGAFNLFLEPSKFGLGRVLSAFIFTGGLVTVIIGGGELFTGNNLMVISLAEKKIKAGAMLRNWAIVYLGNFAGSMIVVGVVAGTGLFNTGDGMVVLVALKIGINKVNLSFFSAFLSGLGCNWLVCMAVWMSFGAREAVSKVAVIFFPVFMFVILGFEHSIANMYFIPAAILAKGNLEFISHSGVTLEQLNSLNWQSFFTDNLIPVTLGNLAGGGIFVAIAYWFAFTKINLKF